MKIDAKYSIRYYYAKEKVLLVIKTNTTHSFYSRYRSVTRPIRLKPRDFTLFKELKNVLQMYSHTVN